MWFERAADEAYRRNGPAVRRLRVNLRAAEPGSDVTADAVRSYFRYWREVLTLESWTRAEVIARTRTTGEHHVLDALSGPGAIVALPHMGNWDWAGAWASASGMPLVTVAERIHPARLHEELTALRRAIGIEVVPSDGKDTTRRLVAAIEQKKLVALVCDRDLTGAGVHVTLLKRAASVPGGPAQLARRTGARLIPATLAYEGRDLAIAFHPPVALDSVQAMMQDVTDVFSAGIAAAPQDWHMMQSVFRG